MFLNSTSHNMFTALQGEMKQFLQPPRRNDFHGSTIVVHHKMPPPPTPPTIHLNWGNALAINLMRTMFNRKLTTAHHFLENYEL